MTGHVNSYYAATLEGARDYPRLTTRETADVCVVGGGLAGLSTARELAAMGKSVIVLEGRLVGFGASGRNGGFVAAGYAEGIEAVARRVGRDDARQLFDLSRDGVRMVEANIEAFGIASAQSRPGALQVVRHDDEEEYASAPDRLKAEYDYDVDYWPAEKVRSHLKSERYFQGLYDASAIHIHPLNYVVGLAAGCSGASVRIYENSPAQRPQGRHAGKWLVSSSEGAVEAEHVVLCHSTYGSGLCSEAGPCRSAGGDLCGHVAARRQALLDTAIDTESCCSRYPHGPGTTTGGLATAGSLWGGRITTQRSEPHQLSEMLKRDIVAIYPQLEAMEIEYRLGRTDGLCHAQDADHRKGRARSLGGERFRRTWPQHDRDCRSADCRRHRPRRRSLPAVRTLRHIRGPAARSAGPRPRPSTGTTSGETAGKKES